MRHARRLHLDGETAAFANSAGEDQKLFEVRNQRNFPNEIDHAAMLTDLIERCCRDTALPSCLEGLVHPRISFAKLKLDMLLPFGIRQDPARKHEITP